MLLRYLFILLIIIPIKAFALIEVDITRGNLNPLPVAVSPLSIDNKSKENFKKIFNNEAPTNNDSAITNDPGKA